MILLSEEHGLYGVEVPGEARDIEIMPMRNAIGYKCDNENCDWIDLPKGKYEILGTVSADTIDFDCKPFINCLSASMSLYKNYNTASNYIEHQFKVPCQAFRSLIEAKTDKYFVNPYGETPDLFKYPTSFMGVHRYRVDLDKHEQAQQNLIHKMVILKKIT